MEIRQSRKYIEHVIKWTNDAHFYAKQTIHTSFASKVYICNG